MVNDESYVYSVPFENGKFIFDNVFILETNLIDNLLYFSDTERIKIPGLKTVF